MKYKYKYKDTRGSSKPKIGSLRRMIDRIVIKLMKKKIISSYALFFTT